MKYPTMGNTRSYRVNLPELNGGVNYSLPPHLIEDSQLAAVSNMWYKDGRLQTRPGFVNHYFVGRPGEYVHIRKMGDTVLAYNLVDGNLSFSVVGENGFFNSHYVIENQHVNSFFFVTANTDESEELSQYQFLVICFCENDEVLICGFEKNSVDVNFVNPYIPVIMKGGVPNNSREASANGTSFEPRNLLTPWFECQYTSDGEGTYFDLPERLSTGIGVCVEYETEDGKTITHVADTEFLGGLESGETNVATEDGLHLRVDVYNGRVWFVDKDSGGIWQLPLAKRGNNVRIRAKKEIPDHFKTACGMSFSTWYGGGSSGLSGGSRLFLSGNSEHPNLLIWSSLNNPLYFPTTNYAYVGDKQKPITAFGKQDDLLVIFKERELYCSKYIQGSTPTLEELKAQDSIDVESTQAMFPMTPIHPEIGCDCPDTICLCENRLVWLNSDGRVYGLFNYSQYNEKNVRVLSKSIERRLLPHTSGFKKACAAENGDYYLLLIEGNIFAMDLSSHGFSYYSSYSSDERAQRAVAWYEWDIKRESLFLESPAAAPQLIRKGRNIFLTANGEGFDGETTVVFWMKEYAEDEEVRPTIDSGVQTKAIPCCFQTKQFDFSHPERYKRINPFYLQITGEEGKTLNLTYLNGNRGYADDCFLVMTGEELENCTPIRVTPNAVRVRDFGFRVASEGRMEVGSLTLNYATMGTVR